MMMMFSVLLLSQLDTLEYIHENEYVHGDIKAANLLLGYTNPHEVSMFTYLHCYSNVFKTG